MDPVMPVLERVLLDLQHGGAHAYALYAGLFLAANVAFVPASSLTLAGGFALGFLPAALLTALVRPTAAVVAFLLARSLLRRWSARVVASRPRWLALERALAGDALRVVTLLRLSPLFPSTLSNYALGASSVPLKPYALGSALGTLPSTFVYAYLGSGLRELAFALSGERSRTPLEYALLAAGLVATVAVVVVLGRQARRQLAALGPGGNEASR